MRTLLIVIVIVVIVGAVGLVAVSVRWERSAPPGELGPSEAQQNRAEEAAARKSEAPQQLGETQIRHFQEQLDATGFATGPEKGIVTLRLRQRCVPICIQMDYPSRVCWMRRPSAP